MDGLKLVQEVMTIHQEIQQQLNMYLLVQIIHIVLKHVQLYQHIIMIHTNILVEHFHKLLDQHQLQVQL